jgi:hypothetical protein
MKITNRHNLSQVWIDAVKFDDYDKVGWQSVTSLIAPVRQQMLIQRHDEEIEEDVTERIWMLLGSACHEILQRAAKEGDAALTEERFQIECLDKEISMKPDRVELIPGTPNEYHLKDFKISSVWSVILDTKWEWAAQTNLYAYGLRKIGVNVTQISMEVLCRDWSKTDSLKNKEYPQDKVQVIPIEVWNDEACEDLLEKRVKEFIAAEKLTDDELPPCTETERWARPDKFAVKKKGATRSTKNCSSRAEAEQYMSEKGYTNSTHIIEFRPGKSVRCEDYCSVSRWCSQYNNEINPPF